MAKPDSVYSLFGLKDPQETAREYYKQAFAYKPEVIHTHKQVQALVNYLPLS